MATQRKCTAIILRSLYASEAAYRRLIERTRAQYQKAGLEPEVEDQGDRCRLWVRGKAASKKTVKGDR